MKYNKIDCLRAALATSAVAVAMATGTAVQAESGDGNARSDQDIIVTAQKRKEVLINVPLSMSVVSESLLERRQATSLTDLQALVPGLNVRAAGSPGKARIILRGINTGGVNAAVSVYVDDTPFGSSSGLADSGSLAADFDTFDVARVEVLRGPQGTLYGASSLGGVLKYVTNVPAFDKVEARGQVGIESTKGGDIGYSGTAMVNVPLGETLAVRVGGFYRRNGGFVDSIGTGGSVVKNNYNDSDIYGGRASLLFKPSDRFDIRLSALLQNLDGRGSGAVEVDPTTLKPLYGRLSQSRFIESYDKFRYRLYNGTVNFDLGFATLNSSTSIGRLNLNGKQDLYLAYAPEITELFGDPVSRPLDMFLKNSLRLRKFTQEFHLSSPSGSRLEWLAGVYYTHEKVKMLQSYFPYDILAKRPATDLPIIYNLMLNSVYKEYAGFANMTWHISDRFDLSLGARYSRNEQSARQVSDDRLTGGGHAEAPVARSAENVFTYSAAPHFKLSDNAAVYARIAKGYRPGGPNVLPLRAPPGIPRTYASDSLISYETGLKADLAGRTFSIDVAAFYLKWKDIQLFTTINDTGVNANGKTAVSKGFEFSTILRPSKQLTVSINGAYTDARLTADAPKDIGGLDGDALPYTPKWSTTVSVDYEREISAAATAYVGSTLRFVGERAAEFDPVRQQLYGRRRILPSYEQIDLNLGVRFKHWSIEAYVNNLNNSAGKTGVPPELSRSGTVNGALLAGIIRPRTIGVTIGANF